MAEVISGFSPSIRKLWHYYLIPKQKARLLSRFLLLFGYVTFVLKVRYSLDYRLVGQALEQALLFLPPTPETTHQDHPLPCPNRQ